MPQIIGFPVRLIYIHSYSNIGLSSGQKSNTGTFITNFRSVVIADIIKYIDAKKQSLLSKFICGKSA